ncbi:DUF3291 domain-containing protein [Hoeflea sp.]|uniref:DUF3291 domain-containing protein n=1 Tax=Hoeflea sp. TaxID=1940281 RepID=UPI0025BE79FA|nr:DUF3291 domain-containing protein [Hoeflea sp.]
MTVKMHVAELNIARPRYPLEDERMAGFTNNLDRINALAERSSGFVWRLTGDGNDATDLVFPDEPDAIVNISVWESAAALEHFVWNTVHAKIYNHKDRWFPAFGKPYFVMWPVAVGHRPKLDEAFARLNQLTVHGNTDEAFGWDGLPQLKSWMEKNCA